MLIGVDNAGTHPNHPPSPTPHSFTHLKGSAVLSGVDGVAHTPINHTPQSTSDPSLFLTQFKGKTVLIGVDDMDVFKGIELRLQAFEQASTLHTRAPEALPCSPCPVAL